MLGWWTIDNGCKQYILLIITYLVQLCKYIHTPNIKNYNKEAYVVIIYYVVEGKRYFLLIRFSCKSLDNPVALL